MKRRILFLAPAAGALLLASAHPVSAQVRLRLATTTSVQDSGLMPHLMPHFEKQCRCKVDIIAVGTGQALKLASSGDVDMVVVHAPDLEKEFVDDGHGTGRRTFMVNDFVIIGPPSDPAGIRGMTDAGKALRAIHGQKALFISRGDNSGTHQKELSLWEKTGIRPRGPRYLQIGQGMGAVLTMAEEKSAYTICDRGTFLARSHRLNLQVLCEGDPLLLNYYSAIGVNPERYPGVKADLARRLTDWLCSPEGQSLIGGYTVNGHQLFRPCCEGGE